jgi:type IV pilus assembly protein PilA
MSKHLQNINLRKEVYFMNKLLKNKKGFTLVELIVVIVILGILAAILVPSLLKWIDKARQTKIQSDAYNLYTTIQQMVANEYAKANPEWGTALTTATIADESALDLTNGAHFACVINRTSSTNGANITITKFFFEDLKTSTLMVYDCGNSTWVPIISGGSGTITGYDANGSATSGSATVSYASLGGNSLKLVGIDDTFTLS